jgi:hypothetical protein
MLYSGREQNPRMDSPRAAADERRAFARRIDCAEGGRARQPVNPSPGLPAREPMQAHGARRRLDID